jgi:hypothetical protein
MRATVFRRLMSQEFGEVRGEMLASEHVLAGLGGRTADQALEAGVAPKTVWRAVCEGLGVPREHW